MNCSRETEDKIRNFVRWLLLMTFVIGAGCFGYMYPDGAIDVAITISLLLGGVVIFVSVVALFGWLTGQFHICNRYRK